jgi:hypothetical protein
MEYWWSDGGQGNTEVLRVKRNPVPLFGEFYCAFNCHVNRVSKNVAVMKLMILCYKLSNNGGIYCRMVIPHSGLNN